MYRYNNWQENYLTIYVILANDILIMYNEYMLKYDTYDYKLF